MFLISLPSDDCDENDKKDDTDEGQDALLLPCLRLVTLSLRQLVGPLVHTDVSRLHVLKESKTTSLLHLKLIFPS